MQILKIMRTGGVRACVSPEPLPRAWHRSEPPSWGHTDWKGTHCYTLWIFPGIILFHFIMCSSCVPRLLQCTSRFLVCPYPMTDAKRTWPLYVIKKKESFCSQMRCEENLCFWFECLGYERQDNGPRIHYSKCKPAQNPLSAKKLLGKKNRLGWQQACHANSLTLILYSLYHNLSIDFTVPQTKPQESEHAQSRFTDKESREKKKKANTVR